MQIKGIIFDFDGTLMDSERLIKESFKYAFKEVLNKSITETEIQSCWGWTLFNAMNYYCPEKKDELVIAYRKFNKKMHNKLMTPYPMVLETLKYLHSRNIKMAIATSKASDLTKNALEEFGMSHYIADVIGRDECKNHKPHPEVIIKAANVLKVSLSECLMVGDTALDINAASNANVRSVLVKWSLLYPELLRECKPDYIINNMYDLTKFIDEEKCNFYENKSF